MDRETLRQVQDPLKQQYRDDPEAARLRLVATSEARGDTPLVCQVNAGGMVFDVTAHPAVGGSEAAGCSGEQLLGALAACAQITIRMVALAMDIELESVQVTVQGELDVRGTLGVAQGVEAGFQHIAMEAQIVTGADRRQQRALERLVERSCVVLSTLRRPPPVQSHFTFVTPGGATPAGAES
ncbi:MAG: OsmC family protein [Chloroflexi bacterium]|nr:OsmC family protein [Chloroflexota bacterium]